MTQDMQPATAAKQGDTVTLTVQVVDVKPSDHKYYGRHDLVTMEVTASSGDIPAGLRFHLRRPHDGTNDLRSVERREQRAQGRGAARVSREALPKPHDKMTVAELIAVADARGIDTGAKPTKAKLLALLAD